MDQKEIDLKGLKERLRESHHKCPVCNEKMEMKEIKPYLYTEDYRNFMFSFSCLHCRSSMGGQLQLMSGVRDG